MTCASCGLTMTQCLEVISWSIEQGYGHPIDFCSWSCLKSYCEWRKPELKLGDMPRMARTPTPQGDPPPSAAVGSR